MWNSKASIEIGGIEYIAYNEASATDDIEKAKRRAYKAAHNLVSRLKENHE